MLCCACGRETAAPRNLLILSVDTLRADALGAAGNPGASTPNIDGLFEKGTSFPHTITPIPRTTPALASLLTGLSPKRHRSLDVGDPIAEVPTLAEILAENGYRTLAVSTNRSAGPEQGLDRGFEHFVRSEEIERRYKGQLYRDFSGAPPTATGWATATTDRALSLAATLDPEDPFFLWVFYFDPHFLYRPPSPWQDRVTAGDCWDLYEEWGPRRNQAGQVFSNVGGVAGEAVDDCRHLYDQEIAFTDREIGRLLAAMQSSGQLDETLVVFVADHGENFGESGLYFEHGSNAHDAALRVPLVVAGPGVAAGRRIESAAGLIDVVPTVLSLLDLEDPRGRGFDGLDLAPLLKEERPMEPVDRSRILFAQSATSIYNEATDLVTTGRTWWRVCINGPRYTLCEIPREAPGVYRLYDHEEDPGLTTDLAAEHPEEVDELLAAWAHWPPETARERVAWTPEFKLLDRPRLGGGYQRLLFHLPTDRDEVVDVGDRFPDIRRRLGAALDRWVEDLPLPPPRFEDPELEETLRSLGYLP